jgi:hypothetical protein
MPVALLESGEDADREGTPETLTWPLAGALASEFQVRPCGNAKPSSQPFKLSPPTEPIQVERLPDIALPLKRHQSVSRALLD